MMVNIAKQLAAALAAVSVATACKRPAPEGVETIALYGAETLISTESELLGNPVDLALDTAGRLYVLDNAFSRILRAESERSAGFLGRAGSGPGELAGPVTLSVELDTVRVVDRGNGRVVVLTTSGEPVRSYPLPSGMPGPSSFGKGGELVGSTMGLSQAGLAQWVDANGRSYRYTGMLVVPPVALWDFTAMKEAVNRGRVPDALRNYAIPTAAADGGLWLALTAEGTVRRFGPSGELVWETAVTLPEVDRIRDAFFAANRGERNPAGFHSLEYFADTYEVGTDLWVLLFRPEDEPSSIVVLDESGRVSDRFDVPDIRAARQLAVDQVRRVLYLAVPSSASVHAVPLPQHGVNP